jgi:hypothetical protein
MVTRRVVAALLSVNRHVINLGRGAEPSDPGRRRPVRDRRGICAADGAGSYLILSHLTREGHPAEIVRAKEEVWAKTRTRWPAAAEEADQPRRLGLVAGHRNGLHRPSADHRLRRRSA